MAVQWSLRPWGFKRCSLVKPTQNKINFNLELWRWIQLWFCPCPRQQIPDNMLSEWNLNYTSVLNVTIIYSFINNKRALNHNNDHAACGRLSFLLLSVRGCVRGWRGGGSGSISRVVRLRCAACGDGRSQCFVVGLNRLMNEWMDSLGLINAHQFGGVLAGWPTQRAVADLRS